jgi:Family of unknown function (DUF5318)
MVPIPLPRTRWPPTSHDGLDDPLVQRFGPAWTTMSLNLVPTTITAPHGSAGFGQISLRSSVHQPHCQDRSDRLRKPESTTSTPLIGQTFPLVAIPGKLSRSRRPPRSPRTLLPMWSQREVIDYALQRRSTLQALRRPGRTLARQEACDADPMLIRAAKHHGEPSNVDCPVCESKALVNLHYVFGDQLGQYSGRIKRTTELEEMAHEFGEFKVVVVEVCPACGWNQMILSYLLGDGVKRKPPRRQQTVEDIYG